MVTFVPRTCHPHLSTQIYPRQNILLKLEQELHAGEWEVRCDGAAWEKGLFGMHLNFIWNLTNTH